jgi:hypothetical protein
MDPGTWAPPDWFTALPARLQQDARSLRGQGVNQDVFTIPDGLAVIAAMRAGPFVVLGGDFWAEQGTGPMRPTYENWDLRDRDGETAENRRERSYGEAERAIRAQLDRDGVWVALVCRPELAR